MINSIEYETLRVIKHIEEKNENYIDESRHQNDRLDIHRYLANNDLKSVFNKYPAIAQGIVYDEEMITKGLDSKGRLWYYLGNKALSALEEYDRYFEERKHRNKWNLISTWVSIVALLVTTSALVTNILISCTSNG